MSNIQVTKPSNENFKKVAVITLNWNNYRVSSRCLISLRETAYCDYTIYFVDNGSNDGSGKKIAQEFQGEKIKFIFNEKNLGFAAGCNVGIRKALGEGCDYILLLNNDCIVYDKNFLNKAVALAESDAHIGIVGGKILFWPDVKRIWSTGGYISFWSGEKHIGYGEIDKGQYNRIVERGFISGALMLIKKKVFEKISLLPEVYFFGKEEWEFSIHAKKAGFRLLYNPEFSVYHEASDSHEWTDPTYVYNGTLSKILYKKRNYRKVMFELWFFAYKLYLNFFFSFKYHLQQKKYLQGIHPEILRQTMLDAVRDMSHVEKITDEVLDNYRKLHTIGKK